MDWRNDDKKAKVTIEITGKDLDVCEDYFAIKAKGKEAKFIQQKIILPLWKEYLKQTKTKKEIKLNEDQLTILKIIKDELNTGLDMIPKEDIIFLARKNGFNKKTTLKLLESLEKSGDLYKPRKDFYKTTSNTPN
jgi:DNA replicative helicase MCM subunit Mcm2 (Cdc46/Mcm family)